MGRSEIRVLECHPLLRGTTVNTKTISCDHGHDSLFHFYLPKSCSFVWQLFKEQELPWLRGVEEPSPWNLDSPFPQGIHLGCSSAQSVFQVVAVF